VDNATGAGGIGGERVTRSGWTRWRPAALDAGAAALTLVAVLTGWVVLGEESDYIEVAVPFGAVLGCLLLVGRRGGR
jgi:hypothetical protein